MQVRPGEGLNTLLALDLPWRLRGQESMLSPPSIHPATSRPMTLLSAILLSMLSPQEHPAQAASTGDPFIEGSVESIEGSLPYLLLPPLDPVDGETYPLVVFLHGIGERGTDNAAQKTHFPERMVTEEYRSRYRCFVLAPQCPPDEKWTRFDHGAESSTPRRDGSTWPLHAAARAVVEVARNQPVDTNRIYLTGLSMGGFGTWELSTMRPSWFAAAAPICGGGDPTRTSVLAGLPLSVWHGDADRAVPVNRSREMVEALRELDAKPDYHELKGVGHDSWHRAYDPDACIDWLLDQQRTPSAELAAAARLFAEAVGPQEKVAFLGDSITQAGARPGGYVDLLREALKEAAPEAQVIPAGISGHKVPDLLARYERDVIEKGATLVFVYIGINDVWHSKNGRGTPADVYEKGLRELVRTLRGTGARVVLATPSVIGERPNGENSLDEMLEGYAALSRRVAEEEGATLCDLRRFFLEHLELFRIEGADRGVLTSDGVHLNPSGNAFVATQAARALRTALSTPVR